MFLGSSTFSHRWQVDIQETEYREIMRDMEQKYTSRADVVSKRLDELDAKMSEIEKTTNVKLQQITELLQQIKKRP